LTDDAENSTLVKIIGDTEEQHSMLWKDGSVGNGMQQSSTKCRGMALRIVTTTKEIMK